MLISGPGKKVKKPDLGNTALDAHSSTQAGILLLQIITLNILFEMYKMYGMK
jgi:hypothetical protein